MKKNNSFEKEVQEVLKENEFSPSDELWGKIKTDLQKDKKRAIIWFYSRIAAGLLLLMGLSFVFINYYSHLLYQEISLKEGNSKFIFSDSIINKTKAEKKQYQTKTNFNSTKNLNAYQSSKTTKNNSINKLIQKPTSESFVSLLPFLQSIKPTFDFLTLQKQSIPFSLIASSNSLVLPEEEKEKKKEKKSTSSFGLTFSGSPSYFSYNPQIDQNKVLAQAQIQTPSIAKLSIQDVQEVKASFKPDFSYSFSLRGSYELSTRFILEAGLQYMNAKSQIQTNGVWNDPLLDKNYACITTSPSTISETRNESLVPQIASFTNTDQGADYYSMVYSSYYPVKLNSNTKITLKDSYHYISIPFKLGYRVGTGRVGCMIFGSLSPELLLRNRWDSKESDNTSINQYTTTRTINMSSGISLALNYKLTNQFSFIVEPSYRIFLFNTSRNEILNTKNPQIVNMEVGLKYRF